MVPQISKLFYFKMFLITFLWKLKNPLMCFLKNIKYCLCLKVIFNDLDVTPRQRNFLKKNKRRLAKPKMSVLVFFLRGLFFRGALAAPHETKKKASHHTHTHTSSLSCRTKTLQPQQPLVMLRAAHTTETFFFCFSDDRTQGATRRLGPDS